MSKELYIATVERLMDEEDMTYEQASVIAYNRMREDLADYADHARQRAKEEK